MALRRQIGVAREQERGGQLSGHGRAAHTSYRGAELQQRMIGHVEVHIKKYKFNEQPCELLSPEGGSEDKGASCR